MKNINSLLEKYTKEEFLNSSFQGINCPKWFGIEISCSNNCKSCWEKAIAENNLKFKDERKFKVGDKVVPQNGKGWHSGSEFRIIKEYFEKGYRISDEVGSVWYDEELKLYEEPQTEFTFQEVIAKNVPGVYVNCDENARIKSIVISDDMAYSIHYSSHELNKFCFLWVDKSMRFKLQEPKKMYVLYEVLVYLGNGKVYLDIYRSKDGYELATYNFVFCGANNDYGMILETITKALTEKEYLEYKECWRA